MNLRKLAALPMAFVITAFANFLAGAVLGAAMAIRPAIASLLADLHAELNPYGWLTILIYGMTYAVLGALAGLRLPWPALAWVQLVVAEAGVVATVMGWVLPSPFLITSGSVLQAAAPVLFLINVLSAVFDKRRRVRNTVPGVMVTAPALALDHPFFRHPSWMKPLDRVAQRGTDVALICFIIAVVWHLCEQLRGAGSPDGMNAPNFLMYYGWLMGTVLHVGLHLYPRLGERLYVQPWQAAAGQAGWGIGVVAVVAGLVFDYRPAVFAGTRILGLTCLWFACLYLRTLSSVDSVLVVESREAARIAWSFAALLGLWLATGQSVFSLTALHLMFLGWMTSLVYSVGYAVFPLLLQRSVWSARLARLQVWVAAAGAFGLTWAFSGIGLSSAQGARMAVLSVGGTLAAAAAVQFILQWLGGRRSDVR